MKILIIINALSFGGAEKQAVMDANALVCLGHDVTIAWQKTGTLEDLLSRNVKHFRLYFSNLFLNSLLLLHHLFRNHYDVVHCHMFWAEKISVLPCALTGHKMIFNEHGLGLWRRWYHILIMRFISLWADVIISSCNAVRDVRINRENIASTKVCTVYNSVNHHNSTKSNDDERLFPNIQNSFVIGFVGRFDEVKRLHLMTKVARKIVYSTKGLMFVLVGDGVEKKAIETEIDREGLADYFYLPGSTLDTAPYYRSFDLFILPSRIEGFSLALLESCSSGTAAIAFDVGGNSEIIQDGRTGYLIPLDDIDQLAQRISYLHKNRVILAKMSSSARCFVEQNFSISQRIKKLIQIYNGEWD